ncbi:TonB-dependent receptor [Algibacter lectus]|uniref:Outer membrane receptor protein involved in Fe transport n=1 Tax=Algibacter lectus TaxID=221126 RepID=A0A090VZT7_9FLAO|nr:TonB-dependent receptor [Algibacter lectus]MWW24181.1 TonB-dependent receptor [Algibacter lectus]TDY62199.1 outer membrane receptor protein involved in Fe transport [Algibacter lectus]GAL60792.1 TonB-dependent receptor [Algibacter lectus]SFC73748.1 Outer membrane receptor proteins, mostly Fe transport [Algibacter lectus]
MKKLILVLTLLITAFSFAQTGSIVGKLTDKEYNNEPLAFANVIIKGTTTGTTSDFDGSYALNNLEAKDYILIVSFVGYQTQEIPVTVVAGQELKLDVVMSASAASLDEVVITTTTRRASETALLLEQKKAVVIKESIGAERLSKIGVSDAAVATTKIAGVSKSEGSGDIYIRGLGDRYLSTTMNGLPIPSDDVNNKNINLNLFSTNIIENVGISKTYSTSSYADQTSGNVDITSKGYSKKGASVSLSSGYNTNVLGLDGGFKRSVATEDATLGFHKKEYALVDLITRQSWDPLKQKSTGNYGVSLSGGQKFEVFGKELKVFVAGSHSKSSEYQEGLFRSYRSNILDNEFTDTESFTTKTNTTGYVNLGLKLNDDHRLKISSLSVNTSNDNVYEQGRNGEGYVFDQDPQEDGAFVRDQNFKQTILLVNQIEGSHQIKENNKLTWAAGYNYVLAQEPNRVRNEANILDENTVQYAHVGDFQQRKSSQKIEDTEYNAYINDAISFGTLDEDDNHPFKLNFGANFRQKDRVFSSLFIGVRARGFQVPSVDQFSETFTTENFENGLVLREREADRYDADLNAMAGYANLDFHLGQKLSGNGGVRFERDEINVLWDVANYVGRVGSIKKEYSKLYPSLNLKYTLNDKHSVRFASSLTQTLPEFKELAPFEYVSPTGRVTRGDPDLEKSDVFNVDFKYEFFPSKGQLISATAFYKDIKNPINLAQTRGSSGIFEYANTGDNANIFGFEFETRIELLKNEDEESLLDFNTNITKMWFNQDLLEDFQYKGITESDLQGASDLILNSSLSYNSKTEKEFNATLTGNYSSDKVFALGSPEDFSNSAVLYNDEIIEKGFFTLDFVVSKMLTEKLQIKLVGRNLLNPDIQQTQLVRNINTGVETDEVVLSYKKGAQLNLSLKYDF